MPACSRTDDMAKVTFSLHGRTARIHLNRAASLNAIDGEMHDLLAASWQRVNDDADIWSALLTAEGEKAFCVGADITEDLATPREFGFVGGITGIGGTHLPLRKPLVAAVQGHVMGGGFELALCADLIVAADTALFSLPETRSGIIDHCGVLHRITRKLPHNVAMDLILTGRRMPVQETHRFGLVRDIVPHTNLLDQALACCEEINRSSPLAASAAKQVLQTADGLPLGEALAMTYPPVEAYKQSQDFGESLTALAERRLPVWAGR